MTNEQDEELLDDLLSEASELAESANNLRKILENASSVECLNDMLSNLDDAKVESEEIHKGILAAHRRVKKGITKRGEGNGH